MEKVPAQRQPMSERERIIRFGTQAEYRALCKREQEREDRRRAREQKRWARQHQRRILERAMEMDWSQCIVPGCDSPLFGILGMPAAWEHPDEALPLCMTHQAVAWRQFQKHQGNEDAILTVEQLRLKNEARRKAKAQTERIEARNATGWIYFLRQNQLVKVGWTSSLESRIKSYGPEVEVLCHYQGTRADETQLHQALKPYRAKGREWYRECQVIDDMVARAIKMHGPPDVDVYWSEPDSKRRKHDQGSVVTRAVDASGPRRRY